MSLFVKLINESRFSLFILLFILFLSSLHIHEFVQEHFLFCLGLAHLFSKHIIKTQVLLVINKQTNVYKRQAQN